MTTEEEVNRIVDDLVRDITENEDDIAFADGLIEDILILRSEIDRLRNLYREVLEQV